MIRKDLLCHGLFEGHLDWLSINLSINLSDTFTKIFDYYVLFAKMSALCLTLIMKNVKWHNTSLYF